MGKKKNKVAYKDKKQEVNYAQVESESLFAPIPVAPPQDRMLRHGTPPPCPVCGHWVIACMTRRGSYRSYRCRACGNKWDNKVMER